jgi:FkbM family methyltransferase
MKTILAMLRRVATLPGLRRLTTVKPLLRVSFAMRGALVSETGRFALNELRPGDRRGTYRLRGSAVRIVLRHHSPDVMVLDEVFAQDEYGFPPAVAAALRLAQGPLRVVDLGANIGLFGAYILRRHPDARILAVEADPENAEVHAAVMAANPAADWSLLQGVAGVRDGHARFKPGDFATSRLAAPGERAAVATVFDVFPHLGVADLLKIDIEGGEWEILADPRFREVAARAVVLEYHAHLCPSSDARGAATTALREGGYEVIPGPEKPAFGAGLVWGRR